MILKHAIINSTIVERQEENSFESGGSYSECSDEVSAGPNEESNNAKLTEEE